MAVEVPPEATSSVARLPPYCWLGRCFLLISPFAPQVIHYLRHHPSRFYRHLVLGAIYQVLSLVDFCEVPPLLSAFAHVPFYRPSIRLCLSTPYLSPQSRSLIPVSLPDDPPSTLLLGQQHLFS
jgi:hypothetical protein